jgi:protein-disulfide isomerase
MNFPNILTYVNTVAIVCICVLLYNADLFSDQSRDTNQVNSSSYNDKIIEDYLLNNPKIIISSLDKYQDALVKENEGNQKKYIQDNKDKIYEDKTDPRVGNPKAKVKIVEFFDYNCGYCKVMLTTKEKLLKGRNDVEIIFKELPVLGETSNFQAQAAIAVYKTDPSKYFDFHTELLKSKNEYKDLESIKDLVSKLGIDTDKFEEHYKNPKTAAKIKENLDIAYALGIRGTPAYIIGDTIVPGAIGYQDIVKMISDE